MCHARYASAPSAGVAAGTIPSRFHTMPARLPARACKRDGLHDASLLAAANAGEAVGGGSWPRVRKQRTPEGAMSVWEINARCSDEEGRPSHRSEGTSYRNQLSAVHERADPTLALGANLRRISIPDNGENLEKLEQILRDAHALSASAPSPARLADITQLQAFAEAMEFHELQETSEALSAIQDACNDEVLLRNILGESNGGRPGAAPVYRSARVASQPAAEAKLREQPPMSPFSRNLADIQQAAFSHHSAPPAFSHHSAPPALSHHSTPPAFFHHSAPPSPPDSLPLHEQMLALGSMAQSATIVERELGRGSRSSLERKEWSAAEDEVIREGVDTMGSRWRRIAERLPGRSDDAVRNRWNRLKEGATHTEGGDDDTCAWPECGSNATPLRKLSPARPAEVSKGTKAERVGWTTAEDQIVVNSVKVLGHKWNKISEALPGRTDHAIRNRWQRLLKLEQQVGTEHAPHMLVPLAPPLWGSPYGALDQQQQQQLPRLGSPLWAPVYHHQQLQPCFFFSPLSAFSVHPPLNQTMYTD